MEKTAGELGCVFSVDCGHSRDQAKCDTFFHRERGLLAFMLRAVDFPTLPNTAKPDVLEAILQCVAPFADSYGWR